MLSIGATAGKAEAQMPALARRIGGRDPRHERAAPRAPSTAARPMKPRRESPRVEPAHDTFPFFSGDRTS